MKPNWNFSILKSKASLNLDSSLVKRRHDTSQKSVGGKVSVGGSVKQKPDLGEISRTGKPYLFKFFSENLCLPGQILLGDFLETGVCHSPCLSPRCRTADGGNSPALEGQSRLTKGQALWEETPGLPSPPDRLLGSSFLMQTVWYQGQVHLKIWGMSQRTVFRLGLRIALGLLSTSSAPIVLSSTLKSLPSSQHLPPYATHLEKNAWEKTSYEAGLGGSHV